MPCFLHRVARSGHFDMSEQAKVPSAQRTDTPPLVALADVSDAPKTVTRTHRGVAARSTLGSVRIVRSALPSPPPPTAAAA